MAEGLQAEAQKPLEDQSEWAHKGYQTDSSVDSNGEQSKDAFASFRAGSNEEKPERKSVTYDNCILSFPVSPRVIT
jgi:hypothetical protein